MNSVALNTDITFTVRFVETTLTRIGSTADFREVVTGVTGLTPTFTVYDPDGNALVSGQAATELAFGVYKYTLLAANNTAEGCYEAVATTTSTAVDAQSVADFALVVDGFEEATTGSGALTNTLAGIVRTLRIRLNDLDVGNYTAEELQYCVNLAYRETQTLARCYMPTETISLVAGTNSYDCGNIFEPISVCVGPTELEKTTIGGIGIGISTWNLDPSGVPDKWLPLGGNKIRVYTTPSTLAAGSISAVATAPLDGGANYVVGDVLTIDEGGTGGQVKVLAVNSGVVTEVVLVAIGSGYSVGNGKSTTGGTGNGCTVNITTVGKLTVYGYGYADPMTLATDIPVGLPEAYAMQLLLDRAEAEARKMRSTDAGNVTLVELLMSNWKLWCEKIAKTVGGSK